MSRSGQDLVSLQIWSTGDPSSADDIMAEDVRFLDLLFEEETKGREEFKKMINSVFKVCCPLPLQPFTALPCLHRTGKGGMRQT